MNTIFTISWEEMGSLERKSHSREIVIHAQKSDVPWHTLKYSQPYSTGVAKGNEFVGRREKVIALANKLLRTPMEPFFVTGQKRVGKTSLALAATDFARTQSPNITYTYVLWGGIAYENPRGSINALGREIVDLIQRTLPGRSNGGEVTFDGSLAPALPIVRRAYDINPLRKYVLIIDEFDEIHTELYLQGNLADTFFANLRALAASDNLCLVLIGGENMPFIMERQGQKLNKFVRFGLDYFSRVDDASRFAEENQIPTRAILSPLKFTPLLESYAAKNAVSAVTIIDDIVATGETLSKKLPSFVRDNEVAFRHLNVPLVTISIASTDVGQKKIREAMEVFTWLDFELRTCDPLGNDLFAFSSDNSIWHNTDEFERAFALCRDLGVNSPLGYGNQGLLVVFPETCPNNTLPIIHSSSRLDAPRKWLPLFPRVTN